MKKSKYPLLNGLGTGMILQLAIGPVFFFIMNLVLQRTIFDGLAGVLAVTIVDYFYISLGIIGIGKLLKNKKFKKSFGIISSIVLMIFGFFIIKGLTNFNFSNTINSTTSLFMSFVSVFILTISSPMTIVFFTSLFTAKAVEYDYTKKDLILFGLGTGLATFLFMGSSVIVFSLIKGAIPLLLIQILNLIVGCLLMGYGLVRLIKVLKNKYK
jgi:threonine/homoserine/homoserine lactone efflux protein